MNFILLLNIYLAIYIIILYYIKSKNKKIRYNKIKYNMESDASNNKDSICNFVKKNDKLGIIAGMKYKMNEIIEVCHTLQLNGNFINLEEYNNTIVSDNVSNYLYKYEDVYLFPFGLCPLYNSSNQYNATIYIYNNIIVIVASKDIKKNEEIILDSKYKYKYI